MSELTPAPQRPPHRAIVMSRGLGTRMRAEADEAHLNSEQRAVADAGVKGMVSVGRPFLDHVISDLADAGFDEVCLVIGPEHQLVRDYYDSLSTDRVQVTYAVQDEPLGTANAVWAARDFAGDERVLVTNADNHYPSYAVEKLRAVDGSATLGFDRGTLVANSNITAERVAKFALLTRDQDNWLTGIHEKPDAETLARLGDEALVSMNCWLFTPALVAACGQVAPSPRGELEIVDAVRDAMAAGERVLVVPVEAGVLDLSTKLDIGEVAALLVGREPHL
ncbi:nucleotidyltransferase family protein [Propionibacteriaceae bacterium Y1923]|uniref:nucleotidyltransferase family protein n=1 Tax=Aestuariimicrobium sp. Y1814 TaxID=3418742 RepID=UPI003C1DEC34